MAQALLRCWARGNQALNDREERLDRSVNSLQALGIGSMSQDLTIVDFLLLLWADVHCYRYFGRQHIEICQAIEKWLSQDRHICQENGNKGGDWDIKVKQEKSLTQGRGHFILQPGF